MGPAEALYNRWHKDMWILRGGDPNNGPYAYRACRCRHHYNFHM